jgi:3-oxoacyl-[acyl-carrier protein] reductase
MARRVAFISGSGRNIGRAIALRLADGGFDVVLNGRTDERACAAVADEVRARGGAAHIVMGDVGDARSAKRIAETALAHAGTIDALVNNAGLRPHQPLLTIDDAQWQKVLDVNLNACFWLARAFLPGMIEKRWGRIINFAGMYAMRGAAEHAPIAAAKHGGWGLAKSIATEFGRYGITANSISPGPIRQDGQEHTDTSEDGTRHRVPLGRTGLPTEVAALVALLCSDDGSFISGQLLPVNGGAQT